MLLKLPHISKKVNSGISAFDVYLRSIFASLPFGQEGFAKLCGIMDLPLQVLMDLYNKLSRKLGEESQKIAWSSIHQNDDKKSEKYKDHSPQCTLNFKGAAGAMECEAGMEIWLYSIEKIIYDIQPLLEMVTVRASAY